MLILKKIWPVFPVIAILFSILLGPVAVIPVGGRTPKILWVDIVVFLVLGIWFLKGKLFCIRLAGIEKWALLYIGIAFFGLVKTMDVLRSMAILQSRVLPVLVLIIVFNSLKTQQDIRVTVKALLVFVVVLAGILLLYGWFYRSGRMLLAIGLGAKSMAHTNWGQSNYLASFFILLILPLFSLLFMKPHRYILVKLASAGVVMIALIFTQSRGAILSFFLGIFLWMGLSAVSGQVLKMRFIVIWLLFFAVLSTTAWFLLPKNVTETMMASSQQLIDQLVENREAITRFQLLKEAWAAFIKSPVIGIGLGNQSKVLTVAESVHNLYVETLLETGLVGFTALVAYLVMCSWVFFRLWKNSPDKQSQIFSGSLMAAFLIALVNAAQEPSFWGAEYAYVLMILIALVCAMRKIGIPDFTKRESLTD